MGIYDRDYIFQRPGGRTGVGAWSANMWIIVINIAVHVLRMFLPKIQAPIFDTKGVDALYLYGHFSTFTVMWKGGLEFWRFITFQFLHADPIHLGFNMLGLYMFGSLVEGHLGKKKYLAFYLTCGVFGALVFLLLNVIGLYVTKEGQATPMPFLLTSNERAPLIGASAGVFGVIMACAYIAPNTIVQLLFPPVSLRMRTMAYAYVALAGINLIFSGANKGGDAAHIGGAIAGYFFIRHSHLLRDFFDIFGDSRKSPIGPKARGGGGGVGGERKGEKRRPDFLPRDADPTPPTPDTSGTPNLRLVREDEMYSEAPSDEEIDRILAKHKEHGKASLTAAEIEALRRATQAKRAADRT